jgi:hypothetical protein
MSKPEKSTSTSTFRMVPITDLNIDPEAQRKLNPGWVKAHVSGFDADLLGYILVNKRANGKLYVVDGQHRVELLRAVGWGDQNIHAEYREGLTQAEEAEWFLGRNDRKAVQPFDKFRVRVTEGDPIACDIAKIVNAHGLVLSDQAASGHIIAVASLEQVYRGGGIASQKEGARALSDALRAIIKAWGNQPSSVSGKVIQSVGMVQLRYNGAIDQKALADKLAPFPGGAPGLLGKGKAMQEVRGRPLHHCIASIIVDVYNKGRRTGKLDAWES